MKKITTENLNLFYGAFQALKSITMSIEERHITSIIGPSGCGKSTLVRIFNRINDLIEDVRIDGKVLIDGKNIYDPSYDLVALRKSVGMVFQRPNPFPLSIYDNVAFGPRIHRMTSEREMPGLVEGSLRAVNLWEDLKDRLHRHALNMPLEQQQRLCIARLIAVKPDVLLMDEPCSALDPVATMKIEELMTELKKEYTIVIVTHNMQQAARISDETGFMLLGDLIEFDKTDKIFTSPADKRTEEYITGRYG